MSDVTELYSESELIALYSRMGIAEDRYESMEDGEYMALAASTKLLPKLRIEILHEIVRTMELRGVRALFAMPKAELVTLLRGELTQHPRKYLRNDRAQRIVALIDRAINKPTADDSVQEPTIDQPAAPPAELPANMGAGSKLTAKVKIGGELVAVEIDRAVASDRVVITIGSWRLGGGATVIDAIADLQAVIDAHEIQIVAA